MDLCTADEQVEMIVRWIREDAATVIHSGSNWKIIINGKPGTTPRGIIEKHDDIAILIKKLGSKVE